MEVTIEQREYSSELNQERKKDKSISGTKTETESSPNIVALIIFLPLAIVVDIIDALDLTGIGAILVRFIDIPILGILWLWRLLKTGPGKNYTFQLVLSFLTELSPFGIVPTWSAFVLYVYFKDTKLGKQTIGKAEKLSKIQKPK